MSWRVEEKFVAEWLESLDEADRASVREAIALLEEHGPRLGRPRVGVVHRSAVHNLKELRPGTAKAAKHRLLFAFDPERTAVLLVAGDKASSWLGWYRQNIPVAEVRFEEHLHGLG